MRGSLVLVAGAAFAAGVAVGHLGGASIFGYRSEDECRVREMQKLQADSSGARFAIVEYCIQFRK
ncbi:hypothetical protein CHU93_16665 [Sandarakinorhabdus cyanobacteriorum]|uniref:Uncharacterized protein n=1 Tax=Sandarakinorhabdus cyanobacteriorum TaxID=1981098 RepID=A0A255Y3Y1_9SPHN|nr:hypothetical protein CHU93_16665 [Sandarakinorhabdus cyanobacteriorum]